MTPLLFLSPRVPWPRDSGAKIRTAALLQALLKHFQVDYMGFAQPDLSEAEARQRLAGCRSITLFTEQATTPPGKAWLGLRTLASGWPVTLAKYRHGGLARAVRAWMAAHPGGIVHADHLHMAPYLELGKTALRAIDEHNVECRILERLAAQHRGASLRGGYFRIQASRMRRREAQLVAAADLTLAVSDGDASDLKAMAPRAQVRVIANGVDLDYFSRAALGAQAMAAPIAGRMVFIGAMSWLPNQDGATYFVREILPLLRDTGGAGRRGSDPHPAWSLDVVGQSPSPTIRALEGDGVRVTGTVEDVRPYLAAAAVCVVPLRIGGGSRLKILEAFAFGVPVVSTPIGCEGLDVVDGRHLLVAHTPQDFAAAIRRLRDEAGLTEALVSEGRQLVQNQYGWPAIGGRLVAEYEARISAAGFSSGPGAMG